MISRAEYLRAIQQHYHQQWGGFEELRWPKGPVEQLPEGFSVLKFQRTPQRPFFTYATCGMSQAGDVERPECFILSPMADESICELLTIIAWYNRTINRLGRGDTINFGRPWLPKSRCNYGLLSTPYLDKPELELLDAGGVWVKILWLIPITTEEHNFKIHCGLEALEIRFENGGLDYANIYRPSVVQAGEIVDVTNPMLASMPPTSANARAQA